ncbi:hypothetical protein PBY51_024940 [Eleginops maclovinus]|uniref:Uncharacterized protein n=1 Tax=Eleginops maclovinus TaxID=56733 RepID=A0AAN7XUR0_ELEMC|nr:hypothetical protein PBY51_024940 [Eleginops maclovinus]
MERHRRYQVSFVFFPATETRRLKGEEGNEANKHIWRQKEMISLVNLASCSPLLTALHPPHRWREMVCSNDPCRGKLHV